MKKANFTYKKDDGSTSERQILNPSFLKESYNSYKDFGKQEVKYLTGIEISGDGLSEGDRERYEKAVGDYYSDIFQTLSEYLETVGLDPKKVTQKTFKKEGIDNFKIEE